MIVYAELKDGVVVRFPYGEEELLSDNPNTKFVYGDVVTNYQGTERNLAGYVLVPVQEMPRPFYDWQTQTIRKSDEPVLTHRGWERNWIVEPKTM